MRIARNNTVGVVLSVFASCAYPFAAYALEKCSDSPVHVSTSSPQVRDLICQGAFDAIERLKKCEIHIRRPVTVLTLDEVRHPLGQVVIALFEPANERILVSAYEKFGALLEGTPYRVIPRDDFFRSMVVHETVHAILNQHYRVRPHNNATHEYPAYALQIASLPLSARELFLDEASKRGDTRDRKINDIILAFDPFLFAARAYNHLSVSPNGCANLAGLLEGKAEFIADSQ